MFNMLKELRKEIGDFGMDTYENEFSITFGCTHDIAIVYDMEKDVIVVEGLGKTEAHTQGQVIYGEDIVDISIIIDIMKKYKDVIIDFLKSDYPH